MIHPSVFDTSEICYNKGVNHAVFSPGSRNAPLSISFHRNKKINKYVIVDERSAGFIGLGIAQQTRSPVVLCCTSGTALLNYGPAIAEAFYQEIPLIIISADRPPEWVDQWDGQTIRQQNIFQSHTKGFFQLPVDLSHPDAQWEYHQKLNQAIDLALSENQGPVHINVPFREPFYPDSKQKLVYSPAINIHQNHTIEKEIPKIKGHSFLLDWGKSKKKIIVLGQGWPDKKERLSIERIAEEQNIPIINDVISNGHDMSGIISHHDLFLQNQKHWKGLKPDLILTLGKSVISKHLKLFLRDSNPIEWHISEGKHPSNPFKSQKKELQSSLYQGLKIISESGAQDPSYIKKWKKMEVKGSDLLSYLDQLPFSEFSAFKYVMEQLPEDVDLHLGNSMPVRYANFVGLNPSDVYVYANRGTSGIDGTNGTAVGNALTSERKVVLLSGDLSFLYDRNAFFHEYDISNLRIIVFNNFGGGIFDMIPGPANLDTDEKERHFTTPHNKDLKLIADEIGFSYSKANDDVTLELALVSFFEQSPRPKLLEIQTNMKANQKVFQEIKQKANE